MLFDSLFRSATSWMTAAAVLIVLLIALFTTVSPAAEADAALDEPGTSPVAVVIDVPPVAPVAGPASLAWPAFDHFQLHQAPARWFGFELGWYELRVAPGSFDWILEQIFGSPKDPDATVRGAYCARTCIPKAG